MATTNIDCPIAGCNFSTGEKLTEVALALFTVHGHSHVPVATPTGVQTDKIKKPSFTLGCTSEKWEYLMARWSTYKKLTKITAHPSAHLLDCCNEDLAMELHRTHGDMEDKSEQAVLEAIKELAVKKENIVVARVRLLNMKQDRDEPVRNFVAKLKGMASTCKYSKKHKCPDCDKDFEVSYSEDMVRDVLAKGIIDDDIRVDILGNPNQNMSLDEMQAVIEAKETGRDSNLQLSNNHAVNATRSSYKRHETAKTGGGTPHKNTNKRDTPCHWCGKMGHSDKRTHALRRIHCPAYNKKCAHCDILHHSVNVCSKRNARVPTSTAHPHASAIESDYADLLVHPSEVEAASFSCNASSNV